MIQYFIAVGLMGILAVIMGISGRKFKRMVDLEEVLNCQANRPVKSNIALAEISKFKFFSFRFHYRQYNKVNSKNFDTYINMGTIIYFVLLAAIVIFKANWVSLWAILVVSLIIDGPNFFYVRQIYSDDALGPLIHKIESDLPKYSKKVKGKNKNFLALSQEYLGELSNISELKEKIGVLKSEAAYVPSKILDIQLVPFYKMQTQYEREEKGTHRSNLISNLISPWYDRDYEAAISAIMEHYIHLKKNIEPKYSDYKFRIIITTLKTLYRRKAYFSLLGIINTLKWDPQNSKKLLLWETEHMEAIKNYLKICKTVEKKAIAKDGELHNKLVDAQIKLYKNKGKELNNLVSSFLKISKK